MAVGTQAGGVCYPTQLEAANAWCSTFAASNTAGLTWSCQAVTTGASSTLGGAASFSWTKRQLNSSTGASATATVNGQPLVSCETYAFDYYAPIVSAFIVAAVAIVAARSVYHRIFARESL